MLQSHLSVVLVHSLWTSRNTSPASCQCCVLHECPFFLFSYFSVHRFFLTLNLVISVSPCRFCLLDCPFLLLSGLLLSSPTSFLQWVQGLFEACWALRRAVQFLCVMCRLYALFIYPSIMFSFCLNSRAMLTLIQQPLNLFLGNCCLAVCFLCLSSSVLQLSSWSIYSMLFLLVSV